MIIRTIKQHVLRVIANNRMVILDEAHKVTGFMHLLMKPRNTGKTWTSEERRVLRAHLKHLSCYVPIAVIFVMPFGSLLIPVLAEILDRRATNHRKSPGDGLRSAGSDEALV